ncbi:uncharacterized protein LOC144545830 isoform X1 [Carex rostrata]
MGKKIVTVKEIVDPQALCNRIQKKMMRKTTIISPVLPPPPPEGEAQPLVVLSQVSIQTWCMLEVPFLPLSQVCTCVSPKRHLHSSSVAVAHDHSSCHLLTLFEYILIEDYSSSKEE